MALNFITLQKRNQHSLNGIFCPFHPTDDVVDSYEEEAICAVCGLVLGQLLDSSQPEWKKNRNNESDFFTLDRHGANAEDYLTLDNTSDLSTMINFENFDPELMSGYKRVTAKEQILRNGCNDIIEVCRKLNIGNKQVEVTACRIFKQCIQAKLIKNKYADTTRIAMSCIYRTCRELKFPIERKKLEKFCVNNCFERKYCEIRRKIFKESKAMDDAKDENCMHLLPIYISQLNYSFAVWQETTHIMDQIENSKNKHLTAGFKQNLLLPAAIYTSVFARGLAPAADASRIREEISRVTNIKVISLMQTYKLNMLKNANIFLSDPSAADKLPMD